MYNVKIARIFNNYYTSNTLQSLIIGAGNTKTDYTRHHRRYNISIGGECNDFKEDLIAFEMYTGTPEFQEFISNVGSIINFVAIDYSVCSQFYPTDLLFLLDKLLHLNHSLHLVMFFRLR